MFGAIGRGGLIYYTLIWIFGMCRGVLTDGKGVWVSGVVGLRIPQGLIWKILGGRKM